MARWAQFGFIVICCALAGGWFLTRQSGRSLEKQLETESGHTNAVSSPVLRTGSGLTDGQLSDVAYSSGPEKTAESVAQPLGMERFAELERQEAKQSVLALLEENKKIRKEVLDLDQQIRRLTHSLAEEKLENDLLRVEIGKLRDQRAGIQIPARDIPSSCEVIDVNEKLNLVVLNRGSDDGIQHRMRFAVIRDNARIAELEAVNVRSRITGAAITFLDSKETIVSGDRVIPAGN